jgi:hypothetical protein
MTDISLQPLNSVEIWSSVEVAGTLYYALLNRDAKFSAEVWRRRANGTSTRLWTSAAPFKCASISLAVVGTSLLIVYSRSSGPDSSTPYRPYLVMLSIAPAARQAGETRNDDAVQL